MMLLPMRPGEVCSFSVTAGLSAAVGDSGVATLAPAVTVGLSYDARVLDNETACELVSNVADCIVAPERALL